MRNQMKEVMAVSANYYATMPKGEPPKAGVEVILMASEVHYRYELGGGLTGHRPIETIRLYGTPETWRGIARGIIKRADECETADIGGVEEAALLSGTVSESQSKHQSGS